MAEPPLGPVTRLGCGPVAGDGRGIWRRLAFALVAVWSVACAAIAAAGPPPSQDCAGAGQSSSLPCGVVAVVGDQSITVTEYEHWYGVAVRSTGSPVALDPPRFTKCIAARHETLPRNGRGTTRKQLKRQCAAEHRALRDQVMQLLISFRWIRGEAEARGIKATPSQVRAQFREQKRTSFPKQKDYEKFLEDSGQTEADILMRVELDLLSNKIRERVTSDVTAVSDQDIKRYYERNRARFALPERRDLLVVLSKTKGDAAAARARIEAGERWATVAKDLSIDRASRSRGGKLRGVADGQQGRALNRALFSAERGELRGPVRTRFGWYVFEVTKIRPARRQSLEQAKPAIASLLRAQRQQGALDTFVGAFTERWRARTICRQGYRTSDCANGPAPRTGP